MATHYTPKPYTYVYTETNIGKFKDVKHYEYNALKESKLTNRINISKNRFFADSNPDYWLKVRLKSKWSNCITGLFRTKYKNVFRGDENEKTHLIIFKFSDNASTLTIKYFENYYTNDLSNVINYINN